MRPLWLVESANPRRAQSVRATERSVSVASEYERDQRPVAESSETGVVDETRRDARGHGRCRLPSIPFIRRRLETVSSW
jgi:hypothetical protein